MITFDTEFKKNSPQFWSIIIYNTFNLKYRWDNHGKVAEDHKAYKFLNNFNFQSCRQFILY